MDPRPAFALVLLLAGCTSPGPGPDDASSVEGNPDRGVADSATPTRLRFASGDFEGTLAFQASFSSLDTCFGTCTATAMQSFDLTSVVPESAPVELTVVVQGTDSGMTAFLTFKEASPARQSSTFQGDQIQLSATVVRDPGGTVVLEVWHVLPLSPSPEPVEVDIEVRAVTRADQLLPLIPASLRLTGGDRLAFAGDNVTLAVLVAPDGSTLRTSAPPLNLTLPADAGPGLYTALVTGGTAVLSGPNTTMNARRLATVVGAWNTLSMGAESTWEFSPASVPLQVGVILRSQDNGASPSPFLGTHHVNVAAPDGTNVLDEAYDCGLAICNSGGFSFSYASLFLDESLAVGTYAAKVLMENGDSVEAAEFYVTVV